MRIAALIDLFDFGTLYAALKVHTSMAPAATGQSDRVGSKGKPMKIQSCALSQIR
jgi:hypothetical protein